MYLSGHPPKKQASGEEADRRHSHVLGTNILSIGMGVIKYLLLLLLRLHSAFGACPAAIISCCSSKGERDDEFDRKFARPPSASPPGAAKSREGESLYGNLEDQVS